MAPWFPPPGGHILYNESSSPEFGQYLWIWDSHPYHRLLYIYRGVCVCDSFIADWKDSPAGSEEVARLWAGRVVRTWEWPPQLITSKKMRTSVTWMQGIEFCLPPLSQDREPRAPDEITALADTLISAWGDGKQTVQLYCTWTSDLQKLWAK